ncbi:MAG: hypothetical protein ACXW0M_12715, partial [Methylosarcina sp.]
CAMTGWAPAQLSEAKFIVDVMGDRFKHLAIGFGERPLYQRPGQQEPQKASIPYLHLRGLEQPTVSVTERFDWRIAQSMMQS